MLLGMKRLTLALLLLLVACQKKNEPVQAVQSEPVTEGTAAMRSIYKRDMGSEWPFAVEYVNLICIPRSDLTRIITANVDGQLYRLNDIPVRDALPPEDLQRKVINGHPEGTVDWLAKEAWDTCK